MSHVVAGAFIILDCVLMRNEVFSAVSACYRPHAATLYTFPFLSYFKQRRRNKRKADYAEQLLGVSGGMRNYERSF